MVKASDERQQLNFSFSPTVIPQGNGDYLVRPGKPICEPIEYSVKQAAKELRICLTSAYQLIYEGRLSCRRPRPRKIWIAAEDVKRFKEATRDSEFWDKAGRGDK